MHDNNPVPLCLAALISVISTANAASAQEKHSPARDFGKSSIERPLEKSLVPMGAIIEKIGGAGRAKSDFVNPKVEPGKVVWHQNFKEACASAKVSGKPVLLFQMMGKLDDRFC